MSKVILKVEDLYKHFDGVKVLEGIDFELRRGEIHGLVGANGSGKSTFMNILSGSKNIIESGGYRGKIYLDGLISEIDSREKSMSLGIGMVHQELSLLKDSSVANNIKLNRENIVACTKRLGDYSIVDEEKNVLQARDSLIKLGVDLNTRKRLGSLPINLKQFVEIAREIDKIDLKVLILDEPTSSLNTEETEVLLKHLRKMADEGLAIIFISHRLEEVTALADKVTVLRDGRLIANYRRDEFDIKKIALDMIGQEVVQTLKPDGREISDESIVNFEKIKILREGISDKQISLDIRRGEVIGITGLAGHGQENLAYGLFGIYDMEGQVFLKGERLKSKDNIVGQGLYLIADDRKELGLMLEKSIRENMVFESYDKNPNFLRWPKLGKLSPLNGEEIDSYVDAMIDKLNIKVNKKTQLARELSGGNQQKICMARAIAMDPEVLFIGEPTKGIDIYSKELILEMLLKMNQERGTTVVIFSGEISELKRVCDRIAIMYENKIFKVFDGNFYSESFNLAISGKEIY